MRRITIPSVDVENIEFSDRLRGGYVDMPYLGGLKRIGPISITQSFGDERFGVPVVDASNIGETFSLEITESGERAWEGEVMLHRVDYKPLSQIVAYFHVLTNHEELDRFRRGEPRMATYTPFGDSLNRLIPKMKERVKEHLQTALKNEVRALGGARVAMTPESHPFYVGSPHAHGKHQWAKQTLDAAVEQAQAACLKSGEPQFVVQVVRIIDPATPRVREVKPPTARRRKATKVKATKKRRG